MLQFIVALCFIAAVHSTGDDVASLVQVQRTSNDDGGEFSIPAADMARLVANSTGPSHMFRIVFTKTAGADHMCLTEIEFMNQNRQYMSATLQYMSSCYGCPVACDSCQAQWGNPLSQFDRRLTSVDNEAWSCTNMGSFSNLGYGSESVVFSLPHRPAKVIIHVPDTTGNWAPSSWKMQILELDGSWQTIAEVKDEAKADRMEFYVQPMGTFENPPNWPIDREVCEGQGQIVDLVGLAERVEPFAFSFAAVKDVDIATNGRGGMSIDGDFGNITLPTGAYSIKQIQFVFPSHFRVAGFPSNVAEGHLNIIAQKIGSVGVFDLANIAILLQLPVEFGADSPSELFFESLGLDQMPRQGEPRPIPFAFDLSVLAPQLSGNMTLLNCSHFTPWYVLLNPAYVTGAIVKSFQSGPPAATSTSTTTVTPSRAQVAHRELVMSGPR
jgi:hypothetical protein